MGFTGRCFKYFGVCLPLPIPMPIVTLTPIVNLAIFMGYIYRKARRDINMCGSGVTHLLFHIFLEVHGQNHTQRTSRCKLPACFATD